VPPLEFSTVASWPGRLRVGSALVPSSSEREGDGLTREQEKHSYVWGGSEAVEE